MQVAQAGHQKAFTNYPVSAFLIYKLKISTKGGGICVRSTALRDEVKKEYIEGASIKELVDTYGISRNTVKAWVVRGGWAKERNGEVKPQTKQPTTALPRPPRKRRTVKRSDTPRNGLFGKYFTPDTRDIYEELVDAEPLTILWHNIILTQAEILRSQQIMHVQDHEDMTTTQVAYSEGRSSSETYEVQQAWDKQGSYLTALSKAEHTLTDMIKQYIALEGAQSEDSTAGAEDWKSAIIDIAKRRCENMLRNNAIDVASEELHPVDENEDEAEVEENADE